MADALVLANGVAADIGEVLGAGGAVNLKAVSGVDDKGAGTSFGVCIADDSIENVLEAESDPLVVVITDFAKSGA